jgi:hypothetical protein
LNYSTQPTEENLSFTLTAEIEAGRTMMVRWIAPEANEGDDEQPSRGMQSRGRKCGER